MERGGLISRRTFLKGVTGFVGGWGINSVLPKNSFAKESEEIINSVIKCDILTYHEVSKRKLIADLEPRLARGDQPVSIETVNNFFKGTVIFPEGQSFFMVTADDGKLSQFDAFSEAGVYLQSRAYMFIPANFFIMTRFEELALPIFEIPGNTPSYNDGSQYKTSGIKNFYMTMDMIIELIMQGHYVGNHNVNHSQPPYLSEGQRDGEVLGGDVRVEQIWKRAGFERPCKVHAYPYGNYRFGQEEYIEKAGFDFALSTDKTDRHTFSTRFRLGRIGMT